MRPLTRRDAVRLAAAGLAAPALACALPRPARAEDAPPPGDDAYGGFRMSIATYSLHKFPIDRALAEIKADGIRYAEVNPQHLPVGADAATIDKVKGLLADNGVRALAYGVFYTEKYKGDRLKAIQSVCAAAQAVGIRVISCTPEPDWMGALEDEAGKRGLRLGIHNHGPKSQYDKVDDVLKAVEKRAPHFGATVDIGHYIRSGEDPVRVIKALGPRVHGFHLKDFAKGGDGWKAVALGKGVLELKATLKALREVGFTGALSLEYEGNLDNPFEDIKACLGVVRDTVKEL